MRFQQSRLLKFAAVIVLFGMGLFVISSGNCYAEYKVTLNSNTSINIKLDQTIDTKTTFAGAEVRATVARDVYKNVEFGKLLVVKKGAPCMASVVESKEPSMWGTPGRLSVVVRSVTAVDGQTLAITNGIITTSGKSKLGTAVICGLFTSWIGGFFIKGDPAIISSEASYTMYTASNSEIVVDAGPGFAKDDLTTVKAKTRRKIVHWKVETDPQGAAVFYSIVSEADNVESTMELYLDRTPLEMNQPSVVSKIDPSDYHLITVVIIVKKKGYYSQRKEVNMKTIADQARLGLYFELVPED